MKKLALAALALALFTGAPTFAEDAPAPAPAPGGDHPKGDHPKMDPEAIFKHIDADGDGKITLAELKASKKFKDAPDKAEPAFKEMDANGDGSVTLEEFKAHLAKHHGDHHDKGGDKGAPKK